MLTASVYSSHTSHMSATIKRCVIDASRLCLNLFIQQSGVLLFNKLDTRQRTPNLLQIDLHSSIAGVDGFHNFICVHAGVPLGGSCK